MQTFLSSFFASVSLILIISKKKQEIISSNQRTSSSFQQIAQFLDLINSSYAIASRRSRFFFDCIYGIICILDENVSSSNPIIILKPFLSSRVYIYIYWFFFFFTAAVSERERMQNSDIKASARGFAAY